MRATVSEIHSYPLRPEGFEEPLFHTPESRRKILEHLACSKWLTRASEAPRPAGTRADKEIGGYTEDGNARVLASWREVDRWWASDGGVDRICYLVRRASGAEVHARPLRAA